MKKHEFKLWNEFKAFINRGCVLDLAVGMIIGGAFTAIVSALVNGILKPLINMIPLSKSGTGLQTVLRPAVVDADGTIITEALLLDWGGVISAIITFLLTALVLFLIIKAINKAKAIGDAEKAKLYAALGLNKVEEAPAEVSSVEEVPAPVIPRNEELLEQILAELKNQNSVKEEK